MNLGANEAQGVANMYPRGMVGRFTKENTVHCYISNIEAVDLMALDFFLIFPIISQCKLMTLVVWQILFPLLWLDGIM